MNDDILLEVQDLKTHFFLDEGLIKAVNGVDFTLYRNRTLCVVGESGCGKSVTARSIIQIVRSPGKIVSGQVRFHRHRGGNGHGQTSDVVDLVALDRTGRAIRDIRGQDIAMIFQEPMTSMSPVHTIGNQLIEAIRLHTPISKQEARVRSIELLQRVGIPQPELRIDSYTFELSGGMLQRTMIAMALSCQPALLIADEPTTALDVTTQAQILELMAELQQETGMSIMLITHDLGVVAEMADDVIVMYLGEVVEKGTVDEIFSDPKHPYTQSLMRSIPTLGLAERDRLDSIKGMIPHPFARPAGCQFHNRCDQMMPGICDRITPQVIELEEGREVRCLLYGGADEQLPTSVSSPAQQELPTAAQPDVTGGVVATTPASLSPTNGASPQNGSAPLLEVRNLRMHFPIQKGILRRTVANVKAVDDINFEIGARETLGLVGESGCGKTTVGRCVVRAYEPTGGQILLREQGDVMTDLVPLDNRKLEPYRRQVRMIFQDPFSSLNPRLPVLEIVGEPLRINQRISGKELEERVATLLARVGLRPEYMQRYPHAFSGGERQRISIARALALDPRLVVADEAVSALDVSVRAQILNLLQDLQDEYQLTYLFISHDLSVVEYLCDRVAVMYVGNIVEVAPTKELFRQPAHPYTEALLSAVPKPDPLLRGKNSRIVLQGDVADPSDPPSGCYFHPRCQYAQERCSIETPELRTVGSGHQVACHFAEELELRGVTG